MRLAVFVNQFPGRTSTFFARDIRGLLASGIEVDLFPIYPYDPKLWRYVPDILHERFLPKNRIHHISFDQSLRSLRPLWPRQFVRFWRDTAAISASAVKYGPGPLAKSLYAFALAWVWTRQISNTYDHILAYWGNYSATCAYVYHRLSPYQVPFSIFLHAGIDLYRTPIYMKQKLLYADNIITCSEFNRQFIHRTFIDIAPIISNKIFIHHHGLDFSEFPYESSDRPPRTLIAVGRLEAYKGFDYLLHAIRELWSKGIDVELELVGDGRKVDDLKELANKLHIEQRVRFRGWLTFDEVRAAMKQATVLVHPSPDLGDGVPNVIKEAMAVGTPVIASHVAGIPELLDDGRHGRLVPPKDIKALTKAIEDLLEDEKLREDYTQVARKYAEEKFDLWKNGKILADFLCSTTRSRS